MTYYRKTTISTLWTKNRTFFSRDCKACLSTVKGYPDKLGFTSEEYNGSPRIKTGTKAIRLEVETLQKRVSLLLHCGSKGDKSRFEKGEIQMTFFCEGSCR